MANKMISGDHLRDEFLSELIRSDEPVRAPDGFMDEVMNRISCLPAVKKATPYQAPAWLKWGIPGVILASLLALLIWGPSKEPGIPGVDFSLVEKAWNTAGSWFSDLKLEIKLTEFQIPETILWILAGGLLLTLSFMLLDRFLEHR
jgi:hypothetical protein